MTVKRVTSPAALPRQHQLHFCNAVCLVRIHTTNTQQSMHARPAVHQQRCTTGSGEATVKLTHFPAVGSQGVLYSGFQHMDLAQVLEAVKHSVLNHTVFLHAALGHCHDCLSCMTRGQICSKKT
jgi:hypothetical protein